jgi:hypothetical protein
MCSGGEFFSWCIYGVFTQVNHRSNAQHLHCVLFRKVVVCLSEGSKIVIDACESFLISMLLPPISSSPSVASTVVTDRYHTPSPLTSGYQTPCEDVPPIPAKIISILQVSMPSTAPSQLPNLAPFSPSLTCFAPTGSSQ